MSIVFSSVPGRGRNFLLFLSVHTGVNPASYPVIKQNEEVKVTTHVYQMPKLRMHVAIPPLQINLPRHPLLYPPKKRLIGRISDVV
jgi:hypothetical protein